MGEGIRPGSIPGRVCVEASYTLAPPRGEIAPGAWSAAWPASGFSVSCLLVADGAGGFRVELRHTRHGGAFQTVKLATTRPHFSRGGVRWWFVCPGCARRVGRLHLPYKGRPAREFKCRRCHALTYESAQLSRSPTRAMYLGLAAKWDAMARASGLPDGCTYTQARDFCRQRNGGHVYRPRSMHFGARGGASV